MGETVGLFLTGLNDYQERLKEDALKRAKHLDLTIDLQLADNDPARQLAQIKRAIERRAATGMTALMVCPVSENVLAAAGRAAVIAGMDWVLLNRSADYLDDLRKEFPQRVIFTVLPDQREIGRIQGYQVGALTKPGDHVLCITGRPDTFSARLRLDGLKEVVGTANPITDIDGGWTSEGARYAVAQWLESDGRQLVTKGSGKTAGGAGAADTTLGIFVAQNDDMALGTRQAVRDAIARWALPLATIPIVGCDGSPRFGQRLVRERRMTCTVAVSSASGPALDWLHRARTGQEQPPTQVVLPVTSYPAIEELSRQAG
jgi:ABC-type sugar transport system substrate-binding protein